MGEDTLEPCLLVHRRCVLVTSPRPPARTATATIPAAADRPHHAVVGHHARHDVPANVVVTGPQSLAVRGIESPHFARHAQHDSVLPSLTGTSTGVFQASRMPVARQTSFPDFLSRATRLWLSTLAFTITRSLYTIGDAPEPNPSSFEPTSVRQQLLAVEIEGEGARLAEEDVDAFAVGHRRAGGVAVVVADPVLFRQLGLHLGVPEDFAIVAIQADEVQLELARSPRPLPGTL